MVFERSSRRITELQFARSLFLTIRLDLDDRDPVRVPNWFFLHLLVSYFPPRSTIPSSYTGLEEYKKSL